MVPRKEFSAINNYFVVIINTASFQVLHTLIFCCILHRFVIIIHFQNQLSYVRSPWKSCCCSGDLTWLKRYRIDSGTQQIIRPPKQWRTWHLSGKADTGFQKWNCV